MAFWLITRPDTGERSWLDGDVPRAEVEAAAVRFFGRHATVERRAQQTLLQRKRTIFGREKKVEVDV